MYQLKLYNKSKTLKKTIEPTIIKNRIQFSANINGGLGVLVLNLNLPITDESFEVGDIIEVSFFQDRAEMKIYAGYISEINRIIDNKESIEIVCYGLWGLLTQLYYNEAGNYDITLNKDPYAIFQDIIAHTNTHYNIFTLEGENVGITANYNTDYENNLKILWEVKKLAENHYYYIDRYNVIFKPLPTVATHTFTLQKDIVEMMIDTDDGELCNRLVLRYNNSASTQVYSDSASIALYGLREKIENNPRIKDLATANEYGTNFIAQNKEPKEKISLSVNLNYNTWLLPIDEWLEIDTLWEIDFIWLKSFFRVKPWDSCKIRNIKKSLFDNLIINKIDYEQELINIHLNKVDNFISLIKE